MVWLNIESKVNNQHKPKLCRAFRAPSGDLAATVSRAQPPLSRRHPFLPVQTSTARTEVQDFLLYSNRCSGNNRHHCLFALLFYVQIQHRFLPIMWQTIWAKGQTAQFGQLLLRQLKQAAQFSTPTGNCGEIHHLCLEMQTTTKWYEHICIWSLFLNLLMGSSCTCRTLAPVIVWDKNTSSLVKSNETVHRINIASCFSWHSYWFLSLRRRRRGRILSFPPRCHLLILFKSHSNTVLWQSSSHIQRVSGFYTSGGGQWN